MPARLPDGRYEILEQGNENSGQYTDQSDNGDLVPGKAVPQSPDILDSCLAFGLRNIFFLLLRHIINLLQDAPWDRGMR